MHSLALPIRARRQILVVFWDLERNGFGNKKKMRNNGQCYHNKITLFHETLPIFDAIISILTYHLVAFRVTLYDLRQKLVVITSLPRPKQ